MPTVKLHYDGWICLPASLYQTLGLSHGAKLTAELADGALVLQPAVRRKAQSATAQPDEAALNGETMSGRRKPGRLRKNAAAEATSSTSTKKRGRPLKAVVTPEPEPTAAPVVRREPWILRKKADLPPAAPVVDKPAPSERRPERLRSDDGFPFAERRPFRHVEVRKLGPGRGHNRPQPSTARQPG
jgi:antitoxin component of MazEF toxin-antitoxin module